MALFFHTIPSFLGYPLLNRHRYQYWQPMKEPKSNIQIGTREFIEHFWSVRTFPEYVVYL